MNRFLPLITCAFVGMAATLVSSCGSRYPAPDTPPPSVGIAYESGTGIRYGPLFGSQYGYHGPPPDEYYGPPPGDDDDYGPTFGDHPQYMPPPGALTGPLPGGPQMGPPGAS